MIAGMIGWVTVLTLGSPVSAAGMPSGSALHSPQAAAATRLQTPIWRVSRFFDSWHECIYYMLQVSEYTETDGCYGDSDGYYYYYLGQL